jgi:hypothetical protein
MCAQLTRVPASAWMDGATLLPACADLLERQFTAFVIGAAALLAALLAYRGAQYLMYRCMLRDLAAIVRQERETTKSTWTSNPS